MDPLTGALATASSTRSRVMERIRLTGLGGDPALAFPMLVHVGQEAWKVKEANAPVESFPAWGDPARRGILWEVETANAPHPGRSGQSSSSTTPTRWPRCGGRSGPCGRGWGGGADMALTGLQIQKLLPKTNCKECGCSTCLAFAMKLAAKKAELKECPYVSEEAKGGPRRRREPPIRTVSLGQGAAGAPAGGETVLCTATRRPS